jgi:O-antigen ligase
MNNQGLTCFWTPWISKLWHRDRGTFLWLAALLSMLLGALVSHFLISISIFAMLPTLFWKWEQIGDIWTVKLRSWVSLKVTRFGFIPFSWFIIFFLVSVFSAFASDDLAAGLSKVQLRLPYVILPLVFWANNSIDRKSLYFFLGMYAILAALVALGVLANYLIQFDQITETLSHGKSIPTPSNHIRFSLFLAFGALSCGYVLSQAKWQKIFKWLLWFALISLVVSLHVLAVRSGLLLFYLGLLYLLVAIWYTRMPRRILFPLLLLTAALPFLAYEFIPSLENRIDYMMYDLQRYFDGDIGSYSDGDRLRSMVVGWNVFKDYFWFGCGTGDIEAVTSWTYLQIYEPGTNVRLPHNQWLYFLATTGLIGTLLSLPALLFAYFFSPRQERTLLHLHGLVLLVSCLFEATLEGTNGVSFHLLFVLLLLNHQKRVQG